ncbi:MAG TPA: hypothetical protein DD421_05010 [Clostridiaceae bacterium]|jgi:hypothetical protein|nr:hypothetical protein [Clostridiaceae bacterium]
MIKTSNINNEIMDLTKEMVMVDNVNLPFSSLLLKKGTKKVSSIITDWKYEKLDNSRNLALEGADASTFLASDRATGDKNICQIISKAVNISGTAGAVSVEDINDLFAHEIGNRIVEAKRDLEWYLVNGVYTEENGTTPRQMKGLVNFITKENTVTKASNPTIADFNNMSKLMRQAGTSGQDLVLLCDYNMTDVINTLFVDKQRYTNVQNEFGSVVNKINLTFGSAYVYTVDAMPVDTMILANMSYIDVGELRPLAYEELSKTGDSRKGQIIMENTLRVLHPSAAVKFTKTA